MYSMHDARWAELRLGNTRHTIGKRGSALVVLAEFLRAMGEDTDPARLNRELALYNGLDPRGWPVPSALVAFGLSLHDQIWVVDHDDHTAIVREWIREQYLVMLVVNKEPGRRYRPHALGALSLHWGDILIHDPALPEHLQVPTQLLPRYGFVWEDLKDVVRWGWALDVTVKRFK